jgi:1-acyl-sn-glycerol-3-phosphate acyltransferase
LLASKLRRRTNRLAQALPIDLSVRALAAGAAVLRAREILVWFPEGHRTEDGGLQPFHFGVGALIAHLNVPAVPVHIEGAFQAMPAGSSIARPRSKVSVRFGPPLLPHQFPTVNRDRDGYQQIADLLRDRVAQLQLPSGTAAVPGRRGADRSGQADG